MKINYGSADSFINTDVYAMILHELVVFK